MWLLAPLAALVLPATASLLGPPKVRIKHPDATIVGSSAKGVDSFLGIPFAQSPAGKNRLKTPQPIRERLGKIKATKQPINCPQFRHRTDLARADFEDLGHGSRHSGEDCLFLNVQRPSSAKKDSKLPVVFWIHGGGFANGGASSYDATKIIKTSRKNKHPIIYVGINYRLNGFGFMPGKEVGRDGIANLGLLDQRLAMEWVQDNIEAFGGDKSKVTIWGESAGSLSVFDHLILYNGDHKYKGGNLFRAAIMDSGSLVPTDPIDTPKAQHFYDTVVRNAGCAGAKDTLQCLRDLSYQRFKKAVDSLPAPGGYDSLAIPYIPRPDGKTLHASAEKLIERGDYARVPFIVGDQEDEGTIFAMHQSNLHTTHELVDYLSNIFFPNYPRSRVAELVAKYPSNPAAGSPFNTGDKNEIYPQYKRFAALIGDKVFTLARRQFLNLAAPSIPKWSYISKYDHGTPRVGTAHGTDVAVCYGDNPGFPSRSCMAYYLSFVNTLNPNTQARGFTDWPQWKRGTEHLINFKRKSNSISKDDFREKAYDFIANPKKVLRM